MPSLLGSQLLLTTKIAIAKQEIYDAGAKLANKDTNPTFCEMYTYNFLNKHGVTDAKQMTTLAPMITKILSDAIRRQWNNDVSTYRKALATGKLCE